jgi:hypothetical protein
MPLHYDCRLENNFCPTASNCSQITGDCMECAPNWQHSHLVILAHDCMQPTWMANVILIFSLVLGIPFCILNCIMLRSLHIYPETLTTSTKSTTQQYKSNNNNNNNSWYNYTTQQWSKSSIVWLNMIFQIHVIIFGIASVFDLPGILGMIWCIYAISGFALFYPIKQRLIHPAFSMSKHSNIRVQVAMIDFILLVSGVIMFIPPLLLCGIGGFTDNDVLFNGGIITIYLVGACFVLTSLAELVWLSWKIQRLGDQIQHFASAIISNNNSSSSPRQQHQLIDNKSTGEVRATNKLHPSNKLYPEETQMVKAIARVKVVGRGALIISIVILPLPIVSSLLGVFGTLPLAFVIMPIAMFISSFGFMIITISTIGLFGDRRKKNNRVSKTTSNNNNQISDNGGNIIETNNNNNSDHHVPSSALSNLSGGGGG